MHDETKATRRAMIESGQPYLDLADADRHWTTEQLTDEFTVLHFAAPFVVVRRKADGVEGSMEFTHSPRRYFNFVADAKERK